MLEYLKKIDTDIFLLLNGKYNEFWDFIMFYLSHKTIWIPFYVLLVFFLIKHFKKQAWLIVILALMQLGLTDQVSNICKEYFARLRPCHEPALMDLVHNVRDSCGGKFGFFSAHAANTFALAVLISNTLGKNIKIIPWIMYIWSLAVSYSRIYVGVHYPGDIIVGILFGAACGLTFTFIFNFLIKKYSFFH